MQTNLLITCGIAFVAVMVLLSLLGGVIRLLTALFPDHSPEADPVLMGAIDKAVEEAFPGSRVTRIELKKEG
jgi:hypothetical protein